MAVSQNPHVYMETVETTKDQEAESNENGNSRVLCAYGCEQSERSLVLRKSDNSETSHDKRKADKQRLLRFSHCLSVCARQLLKPPCTERYARWCERTAVSHRLLLNLDKVEKTKHNIRYITRIIKGGWRCRRK